MAAFAVGRLELEQAVELALKFARVCRHGGIREMRSAATDLARLLQELLERRAEHGIAGINCVLRITDQMGKADLVLFGVIALRGETIGDPHLGLRPVEE